MMKCTFCDLAGTLNYSLGGKTILLCSKCYNRNLVQDAYEALLYKIDTLTTSGKYEDAIGLLDKVFIENKEQDEDGWLFSSILSHKALIYFRAGFFDKSLEIYLALKEIFSKSDFNSFLTNQLAIANVLRKMGNLTSASEALELALDQFDRKNFNPALLSILIAYAEVLDRSHAPMPKKYATIVSNASDFYGVNLEIQEDSSESLVETISTISKAIKLSQVRLSNLHYELNQQANDFSRQLEILDKYIELETVGLYKSQMKLKKVELTKLLSQ